MAEPCMDCGTPTDERGNARILHPLPVCKPMCVIVGIDHWANVDEPLCPPCQDMALHSAFYKLGLAVDIWESPPSEC